MDSAFARCDDIQFNIPKSMTVLNGLSFLNITSFNIPPHITAIGKNAFFSCPNLTSIVIAYGVKSIGDGAFALCKSLQSITIPDTVTEIGEGAFIGCSSLTTLTIPNSVKKIAYNSFDGLQEVRINQKRGVIEGGFNDAYYESTDTKIIYLG